MRVWRWSFAALVLAATPLQAAWFEATTAHFRVIGEGRANEVQQRAIDLEQFDGVMRSLFRTQDEAAARANPLTVYVVADEAAVQRYCRCGSRVAGFYKGRAAGSIAFVPRLGDGRNDRFGLRPQQVLFHEYGHHFLLANSTIAVPAWFSEGYAEFVGTFRRDKDRFILGAPPLSRAYGLLIGGGLSWPELLTGRMPSNRDPVAMDALYGRGWLLTHYLMLDDGRRGQLSAYLEDLNKGVPPLTAAEKRFGDLKTLSAALDRYLTAPKINVISLDASRVPTPPVTLRPLTEGEAALIELRMKSTSGVDAKEAADLWARARPLADRYAKDAVVQGWAAEMAHDADDLPASATYAERALALDPAQPQALLYLARVRFAQLRKTGGDAKAWADARKFVVQANRRSPDAAEPLMLYYQSFRLEGRQPPPVAVDGLLRAQELAPQDGGLRMLVVRHYLASGDRTAAARTLRPLAFDPHRGSDNPAARLLAKIEGGTAKPDDASASE